MKTKTLFYILPVFLLLCANSLFAEELVKAEKDGIELIREEEKLAHDVYISLHEKWKLPIFNNISNAETRHFNAIGFLIKNFNLNDPALESVGKFRNQELQHLYDSLLQQGSQSLAAALKVGAFIEEVDIQDLQQLINGTSNEILQNTYSNLLRASGNHLRAFTGQLQSRGEIYSPLILDKTIYNEIIEAAHQHGGGINCVVQGNNFVGQQNNTPGRNRNRGKGRMSGQGAWN